MWGSISTDRIGIFLRRVLFLYRFLRRMPEKLVFLRGTEYGSGIAKIPREFRGGCESILPCDPDIVRFPREMPCSIPSQFLS